MIANNSLYRKVVIFLLKHSNIIAVFMMVVAFFVCFSENVWYFVICLFLSSAYLSILTNQYINADDDSNYNCTLQYGCQIAMFSSRLSILSNITICFFGLVFSLLVSYYLIYPPTDEANINYFDIKNSTFIIGWFKLMFIYIISDKIHSLQLLLSVLFRYAQSIRFLNILVPNKNMKYPIIFLNKQKISPSRYYVTDNKKKVNVIFDPPLSINDNSSIEYTFIAEDDEHVVHKHPQFDVYDNGSCFFRCHVSIRNSDED